MFWFSFSFLLLFLGKGMEGWSWSDFVLCLVARQEGPDRSFESWVLIYIFTFYTFLCFLGNRMEGRSCFFFHLFKFFSDDGLSFLVVKRGFWMISSLSFGSCKIITIQISWLKWCLSSLTIPRTSSTIWPKLCKNLFPFTSCLAAEKIAVSFLKCLSFGTKQRPIVCSGRTWEMWNWNLHFLREWLYYFSICAVNNQLWNSNRLMPMSTSSKAVVPGN